MPVEMFASDSAQFAAYVMEAMWIMTGLCAVVITVALAFFTLTAGMVSGASSSMSASRQIGVAKRRRTERAGVAAIRTQLSSQAGAA